MKGFGDQNKSEKKKESNKSAKHSKEQIINQAFKFHSQGNISEAAKYYQYCLDQGFNDHRVFSNYGAILKDLGKLKEAELSHRKAIELKPDFTEAHSNLGTILKELGNLKEAELSTRKAIEFKPDFADAHSNLGGILKELGNLQEAEISHRKATTLKPDYPEGHYNLGNTLRDLGNLQEAEISIRKAIELNPHFANAHLNLGLILKDLDNLQGAEISTRTAIELNPDLADAHSNLGTILRDFGNLQEAEISTRTAIELKPEFADAHSNLGTILMDLGNLKEAEISARKAIEIKPEVADAHYNLSFILLKAKKFKEGFNKYEWRWKVRNRKKSIGVKLETSKPEWTPNNKARVLLWAEQGLGDEILFASLIPELVRKVDQLIVKTDERLIPLFQRSFDKQIIYINKNNFVDEEKYDFQIAMGSLPKFLRKDEENFKKGKKQYLKVDERKTNIFRDKLKDKRFKKIIGISWKSNSIVNKNRSLSLEKFILGIYRPEICFVCLQYGDVKEEIKNIKNNYGINIYEFEEIDKFENIDDLTALASICDEIVSIENMTEYIAGGLGIKSYILLTPNCLWHNGCKELKSDWFPSLNFVRQENETNWEKALNRIKHQLKI